MKFTKLIFPTVLILVLIGMSWVVIENYKSVQKLNEQGKPAVTVATPLAGKDGRDGRSAYQIWLDNGHKGSEREFLNWLKGDDGYTPVKNIDYFDGNDGKDGLDASQAMVESAVVEYCLLNGGCRGEKGEAGKSIVGAKGDKGDSVKGDKGDRPILSCIIRWDVDNSTVTRYWLGYKYEGENDSSYRNLYRIPSQQRPDTGCVDLRQ